MKKIFVLVVILFLILVVVFFVHRRLVSRPSPNIANITETIEIFSKREIKVANSNLTGLLFGLNYDANTDYTETVSLISALKPASWRLSNYGSVYNFVVGPANLPNKFGTKIEFVIQDTFNQRYGFPIKVSPNCGGERGCFNSFNELNSTWRDHITLAITEIQKRNIHIDYYDIFAEPNWGWEGITAQEFSILFKTAYDNVKSLIPNSKITVPSYGFFDEKVLGAFMDFAYRNNIKIDAIAWHELDDPKVEGRAIRPDEFVPHIKIVQAMMKEKLHCEGVSCPEIHINEYQWAQDYFTPGWALGWLYYFTDNGVAYANRACWDEAQKLPYSTCFNGFNGLLSKDNTEPQNLYWVYKAYADLSGKIIETKSNNLKTVALASVDQAKEEMKIIVGRYDQADSANIKLVIKDFPFPNQEVKVSVKKIPNPKNRVSILGAPISVSETIYRVHSDSYEINIENAYDGEVYLIDIIPE